MIYISSLLGRIKGNKMLLHGSMFSLFSFINRGIGFILLIILAKYIVPAEYGQLSLFNTVVSLMGLFICLSTDGYISISYFQKGKRELSSIIGIVILISISMTLLFSLLVIICGNYLCNWIEIPVYFLWLSILISFFYCIFNIHQNLYIVKEKVINFGFFNCSYAVLNFVLSLILVICFQQGWRGRVEAWTIVTLLLGCISLFMLIKEHCVSFDNIKAYVKEVLLYGLPIIPHLATVWIKQGCDNLIINDSYTLEEVGVFSFALNLTSLIVIIGTAFNSTNSVTLFKILSDKLILDKMKVLRIKTRQMILVYLIASILIVIFTHFLVAYMMPRYIPSVPYFYILSIYGFLQCIYLLYCNYFFYYKQTKSLMYITFITSILHFVLSILFTRYSLYCTAIIYILSQSVIDILVFYYGRALLKKGLEYEKI